MNLTGAYTFHASYLFLAQEGGIKASTLWDDTNRVPLQYCTGKEGEIPGVGFGCV